MEKILIRWVRGRCEENNVVKALPEVRKLAFETAATILLGEEITADQMKRLMADMDVMMKNFFTLHVDLPGTGFHQAMVARKDMLSIMEDIIKKKRRLSDDSEGGCDALSILLTYLDYGKLSLSELTDGLIESLFSSQNGIPSLCCSTLIHLSKHPDVVSKLLEELCGAGLMDSDANLTFEAVKDLPYLEQVWKEITRISPPFGGGFRQVLKTFELEGYQIPAGWTVLYSIRDNHDAEENFSLCSEFNPDRWSGVKSNDSWIPFGGNGIRSCVGQKFVVTMLRQFISVCVKYSQWELHETNPGFNQFPVLLPDAQLPMVFHRKPMDLTSDKPTHSS